MATKNTILSTLQLLADNFRVQVSENLIKVWAIGLEDLEDDLIKKGIPEFIKNDDSRFFPPVGVFRKTCKQIEKKERRLANQEQKLLEMNNQSTGNEISYEEWKQRTGKSIAFLE